jgi:signal transduction histidine kinase
MNIARSALLLVVAVVTGGVAMGAFYGVEAGLWTAVFLTIVWSPVLVLAHVLVAGRARLGSLPTQLGFGVAIPVGLGLLGIQLIAVFLFVSAHDAFTMALLLGSAGVLAGYCVWLWTNRVTGDIRAVRDAVAAVGNGDPDLRVELDTRDEMADLAGEVNRLADRLAAAERERDALERSRRELFAAISHDLRTPLSSLRLLTDSVGDGMADAQTSERLGFHVDSLESLIDDLFELSRIEAGDVQWLVEPVDLADIIEETVEGMRLRASEERVTLGYDLSVGLPRVRANPEKIQRVLFNLLENAIHHTPADGTITVTGRAPDDREVVVEVADVGTGIDEDDRERVFEPFHRGGMEASRSRDGAGLGLPICRAIVEAHHGRIWLEDATQGTRICFALPMDTGVTQAPRDVEARPRALR